MAPQLYLITPSAPEPAAFARQLMGMLTGPEIAAILVRRGDMDADVYQSLCERIIQIGQAAGAAVLLEDDVELARQLGADGVHISSGGTKAIRAAVSALKPDGIVGVGNVRSRHDAMSFGELDVDYVMFGPLGGEADAQASELVAWWAETFEVPAVHSDPAATPERTAENPAEFVALSDTVWSTDNPVETLRKFDEAVRPTA